MTEESRIILAEINRLENKAERERERDAQRADVNRTNQLGSKEEVINEQRRR